MKLKNTIDCYDKALKINADYAELVQPNLLYFINSNNFDKAIEYLDKALEKNGNFAEAGITKEIYIISGRKMKMLLNVIPNPEHSPNY